jgi:hypothetical protein
MRVVANHELTDTHRTLGARAVPEQARAEYRSMSGNLGGGDRTPSPTTPLTALLSWVWIANVIEVDNAFETTAAQRVVRPFRISLPMWTNGLRFIVDDGVTVDELRSLARAACNLGGLERWGWITVGEVSNKRREGYGSHRGIKGDTALRPTRAGAYARRAWPRIVAGIEERWRTRFGTDVIDALRAALTEVVVSMPWSPPEVHPSNGFRTHVVEGDAAGAEVPFVALLGQVLTAFTLEEERNAEVSLPLGANVLRVIDADVVRIRDLPALSGVSKEAIAMAMSYLQRRAFASAEPERRIRLTASGLDALDGYRSRASQTNRDDLRAALEAIVAQRDSLAEGLVPPEGCWRGLPPYLAQTKRLLADPTKTLPWQPMVLHRGGWPDGS